MTADRPGRKRTSAQRHLRGTVYPRGRKWAYMIDLGPDPLTGKRRQQARSGFDSEREAWDALAEANAALRADAFVPISRRTVEEFLGEWLAAIEHTVKPTTFANYSTYARAYIIPALGHRKLQDVEAATVSTLYQHLLREGRRRPNTNKAMYELWRAETAAGTAIRPTELAKQVGVSRSAAASAIRRFRAGRTPTDMSTGLSRRSVASIHVMLHRAMRDAVKWRYLASNPVAAVEPPRWERRAHRTWTPVQLATFLRHARGDRFYAMWLLLATTGLRRSEAAGARREAFDPIAGTISIVSTSVIAAGHAHSSSGKTRRSRRLLALDPATVAALRAHLEVQERERAAWGPDYRDHALLFCWPDGRPLYPDTITERFGKLVESAGLPLIHLHDVRHTYATTALRAGVHPKIVSTRLGHATVAFTLDTYTADVPELDRAAAEQISALFLLGDPQSKSGDGHHHED